MNINNGVITYPQIDLKVGELQKVAPEGYVYIFNENQSNEHVSGEYLAYRPTTPIIVIKIKKEDFEYSIKEKVKM